MSNKTTDLDKYYEDEKRRIEENYTSGVSSLDKNKQASSEMAAVTRERLMKYLPQQLKAQGIHTQGVSEDAIIKALNNYQNTMAGISQNYDSSRAALDKDKNDSLSKLEGAVLEKKEAAKTNHLNVYNQILSGAQNGSYNADAVKDLAAAYGGFSDNERNTLISAAVDKRYNDAIEGIGEGGTLSAVDANNLKNYLESNKDYIGDAYTNYSDKLGGITVASPDATDEEYQTLISEHNVNPAGSVFDTKNASAEDISSSLNVAQGEKQTKHISNILLESKRWGEDKNGTVQNFNYGLQSLFGNNKGNYFVFYNGKWYQTNHTTDSYREKHTPSANASLAGYYVEDGMVKYENPYKKIYEENHR